MGTATPDVAESTVGARPMVPARDRTSVVPAHGRMWHVTAYVLAVVTAPLLWVYFFVLNRTTVIGRRHARNEPNTLLLSNHQSPLDSFLIALACLPQGFIAPSLMPWHPAAAEHWFPNRVASWFAHHLRCIPIGRDRGDARVLFRLCRVLRRGVVIMFPEGARSRNGAVGPGYTGAGFLALRTGASITPVAVHGLTRAYPFGAVWPRIFKRMSVSFGAPVTVTALEHARPSRDTARDIVDRALDAIRRQHEELVERERRR